MITSCFCKMTCSLILTVVYITIKMFGPQADLTYRLALMLDNLRGIGVSFPLRLYSHTINALEKSSTENNFLYNIKRTPDSKKYLKIRLYRYYTFIYYLFIEYIITLSRFVITNYIIYIFIQLKLRL